MPLVTETSCEEACSGPDAGLLDSHRAPFCHLLGGGGLGVLRGRPWFLHRSFERVLLLCRRWLGRTPPAAASSAVASLRGGVVSAPRRT